MKFVIATNNEEKLKEIRVILNNLGIEGISLSEAGINVNPEETGTTFEENAEIKAIAAMQASGLPAVADDSGLVVDALDGEPGIYSARYGGTLIKTDMDRNKLLLKKMEQIRKGHRAARFVSCIACVFPNGEKIITRGECDGEIAFFPAGNNGFGYDPIFIVREAGRSMAQISTEEKNRISHRARALKNLRDELVKLL